MQTRSVTIDIPESGVAEDYIAALALSANKLVVAGNVAGANAVWGLLTQIKTTPVVLWDGSWFFGNGHAVSATPAPDGDEDG